MLIRELKRWRRILGYPSAIFRKSGYVDTIDISSLVKEVPAVSARRHDGEFEVEDFDGVRIITKMPFEPREIIDMSMNLIGGKWEEEHAGYADGSRLKSGSLHPWIYIITHPDSVKFFEESKVIYMDLGKVHGKDFEFPLKFESKNAFDAFFKRYPNEDDSRQYVKNEEKNHKVRSVITHDPTYLNYWHVVLNIEMNRAGEHLQVKSPYKKVVEAFWNKILSKALFDYNPHKETSQIDSKFYMK